MHITLYKHKVWSDRTVMLILAELQKGVQLLLQRQRPTNAEGHLFLV